MNNFKKFQQLKDVSTYFKTFVFFIVTCFTISMAETQQEGVFPTDLPSKTWSDFNACGFDSKVCGIIYRDGEARPGMPLGSLGTGFMNLGTDGTLDYVSTVYNAFCERRSFSQRGGAQVDRPHLPTHRLPFLGVSAGNLVRVLSLNAIEGVKEAEQIHYWGHYPIADLEYDLDLPVAVSVRAWSPFIPGNSDASNVPGSMFRITVTNKSQIDQNITLAFSYHGPREEDLAGPGQFSFKHWRVGTVGGQSESLFTDDKPTQFKRKVESGDFTGVTVTTARDKYKYSYALGFVSDEETKTNFGGELGVNARYWNDIAKGLPQAIAQDGGASASTSFVIKPNQKKEINLILTWYAPLWKAENDYLHRYSTRFNGPLEIARHLAKNHESLLGSILSWQNVIYSESTLPNWLKDGLINVSAVLTQQSFWLASPDPEHWWGKDGFFCVNESLISCPQQACIANDEFGEWIVNLLFPDLGLNKLRAFKHYQREDGLIPSTLGAGAEPDAPWYEQQLSIDSQVYVHMIDRYRLSTGDDTVLNEWYPSIKRAMIYMFSNMDKDDDALIDTIRHSQYYDAWPMDGAAIHVSGYWLATLKIVERMAKMQNDSGFSAECTKWYNKALKSLDEKLWNEAVGSYLLYHDTATGKKSDTVIADQLIGQWFAQLHGLGEIFSPQKVDTVLHTVERLNVKATQYGIKTAVRPDGGEDTTGFYAPLMTPSYSMTVPSMLMLYNSDEHFKELGAEVMRRNLFNIAIRQNMLWDQPCMVNADGARAWGLEYYHNTMWWTLPLAFLEQDIRSACSPKGFIYRVREAGVQ